MRLLLDTNILIDYFGRREPFFDACNTLRIAEMFHEVELWASAKSFTDVFYVLERYVPADQLQQAFLKSRNFLHIASVSAEDVYQAAECGWNDFEDCLVYIAARNIGADCIITRDKGGFARSSIPVASSAEFVSWLRDIKHRSFAEVRFGREEIEAAKAAASLLSRDDAEQCDHI